MATNLNWTSYNAADTAVAGASMNALANGNFALGAAIDNTSLLYTDADLLIVLSSAVTTAGTGAPTIQVWLLPAVDGSNYPAPPGASANTAPSNLLAGTIMAVPGTSTSVLVLRGIIVPPALFKIQIQNNLGVAFPATNTSVCSLYRYRLQNV